MSVRPVATWVEVPLQVVHGSGQRTLRRNRAPRTEGLRLIPQERGRFQPRKGFFGPSPPKTRLVPGLASTHELGTYPKLRQAKGHLTLRFGGGVRSGPSAATGCWAACESRHSCTRLRSWALIATTTVLADIRTAPTAGVRRTPHAASTPAARGMATMLYPAAHHRFWSILR